MRDAYNKLVSDPREGELNKFVLHTESMKDGLPSLYEMSQNEIGTQFLPIALLALGMGIITEVEDPETQRKFYAVALENSYGDVDYFEVGAKSFGSILEGMKGNLELSLKIEKEVVKQLNEKYRSNDSKRLLQSDINKNLKEFILPSYGGNPLASEYKNAQKARNSVFDNQLKLL